MLLGEYMRGHYLAICHCGEICCTYHKAINSQRPGHVPLSNAGTTKYGICSAKADYRRIIRGRQQGGEIQPILPNPDPRNTGHTDVSPYRTPSSGAVSSVKIHPRLRLGGLLLPPPGLARRSNPKCHPNNGAASTSAIPCIKLTGRQEFSLRRCPGSATDIGHDLSIG